MVITDLSCKGQTNGLVFPSSCDCPKPLNYDVLLPDGVLKAGSFLFGHNTCCWMVRPHVWNLHIQSPLAENKITKNSHVSKLMLLLSIWRFMYFANEFGN